MLVIAKLNLYSQYLYRLQVLQILKMITDREEFGYEYMETVWQAIPGADCTVF